MPALQDFVNDVWHQRAATRHCAIAVMFSLLTPQGLRWTLVTAGTGLGAGTAAFLLFKRAGQQGLTKLLGKGQ
jgi:hypothetical protein